MYLRTICISGVLTISASARLNPHLEGAKDQLRLSCVAEDELVADLDGVGDHRDHPLGDHCPALDVPRPERYPLLICEMHFRPLVAPLQQHPVPVQHPDVPSQGSLQQDSARMEPHRGIALVRHDVRAMLVSRAQ